MKPAKALLLEAGSGCCLMLPLIGLAATAAEPLVEFDLQTPNDPLPYPAVGLASLSQNVVPVLPIDHDSLTVWPDANDRYQPSEALPVVLDLHAYEADVHFAVEKTSQIRERPIALPLENSSVAGFESTPTRAAPAEADAELSAFERSDFSGEVAVLDEAVLDEAVLDEATLDEVALDEVAFGALHVELRLSDKGKRVSTLVKGAEDGRRAIDFGSWRVPFNDVNQVLDLTAVVQADGQMALRSPDVINHVELASLPVDPDLGQVWTIDDIENYLGTSAEFNRADYSIAFNRAALNQVSSRHPKIAQAEAAGFYTTSLSLSDRLQPKLPSKNDPPAQPYFRGRQLSLDLQPSDAQPQPSSSQSNLSQSNLSQSTLLQSAPQQTGQGQAVDISAVTSDQDLELGLLLVGIAIDNLTTVEATLVKGRENGEEALSFAQWLIPFDDAMTALGISTTVQSDGQLMLQSPGIVTLLDLDSLASDPELGPVLSVAAIEARFGISADFNLSEYAINFRPPVLNPPPIRRRRPEADRPIALEGLPLLAPAGIGISGVRQAVGITASDGDINVPIGQVSAVGSVLGGSWYTRLDQPSVSDYRTWQLRELQYLRQSDRADYAVGSQPVFWRDFASDRRRGGDFWGLSTTQRWGFTPRDDATEFGFSPSLRRQADQVGRTVSGEAEPGSLAQLTLGLNGPVVDEMIVDSSGLYRFESVPAVNGLSQAYSERGYQVQLYTHGLRTNTPETRSAIFTSLPGQLPQGAGALIASVGTQHQPQSGQILGRFNQLQGGVSYRHGVTESLTLGTGLIQDGATQALAEAFYLPESLPLQAAFAAAVDLGDGQTQFNADIRYRPAENLNLAFLSDRFSQRFNATWKVSPNFSMTARGNTRERSLSMGARTFYRTRQWSAGATASLDTRQNFRWSLNAQNKRFRVANRGNEISTYSEVTYRPFRRTDDDRYVSTHQEWLLSYETRGAQQRSFLGLPSGQLAAIQWRYRAPSKLSATGYSRPFDFALGYGLGSRGAGPLASVSAALTEGLDLEMQYQSVSSFSDTDSFRLSLVSRLRPRQGQSTHQTPRLSWASRRQNRLRTQGGLIVQPFFDDNGNGRLDPEESLYLEEPELLFQVNYEAIDTHRMDTDADGVLLTLSPDTYRLDIDPAGLPLDRTVRSLAYAVRVVPGHYTHVAIPMSRAYTVSGVVLDATGQAVSGVRVEAVGASGHRQLSITNGAGVYYLERLQSEAYDLTVNGVLSEDNALSLEGETDPFQTQEIHLL